MSARPEHRSRRLQVEPAGGRPQTARIRNPSRRCSNRRPFVCGSPRQHVILPLERCSGVTAGRTDASRMALPTLTLVDSTDPDRGLTARLRAGEAAAFDAIFAAWYTPLVRFVTRIVGDSARAEDVVQDTMLALWRGRESLDPCLSPQAWLFHATRNRALNVIRHDGIVRRAHSKVAAGTPGSLDARSVDADQALADAELHSAIDAAVAALPPRCRNVFVLSRAQGMRHSEIAATLGISTKTVEAHMTHALRVLRQALAAWLTPDLRSR